LAQEVMQAGGLAGAVFNAAKEVALDHFIAGQIGFMQMSHLVEETLGRLSADPTMGQVATSLDDVLAIDHLARVAARELASGMTKTA
jgi:1-deoxy-D-xylulose-5-phosphate reductoisomerase